MSQNDPIVITGAMRTPLGGFQGELASLTASELGATAIGAALTHSNLDADSVDEVVMGCVLPAGQGQAPARQAALGAGLPLGANAQDQFAINSLTRAKNAIENGDFDSQVVPCTISSRKGEHTVSADEQPHKAMPEKIPQLRPAFASDGTVTAANSSSISDGAAALVLMRQSEAAARSIKPLATILGHATHAHEPNWFTTAPVHAMRKLLDKIHPAPALSSPYYMQ